jgi:hypothetical protein
LQQMLMLTPGTSPALVSAPPLAPAPAPVLVSAPALMPAAPVAAPAAPAAPAALAIPVQESGSAQPSPGAVRRLLHLDVILPLIAVAIVLVVLLAWLG